MIRTQSQSSARSWWLQRRPTWVKAVVPKLRAALPIALAFGLAGCAGLNLGEAANPTPKSPARCDESVQQRAATEKLSYLDFEVKRLREDLQEAESSMLAIESGMRGQQSRADSVSAVAEARIAVERVAQTVPWRAEIVAEALQKLDEAERELKADHRTTAIFFASRARRIAATLDAEKQRVATTEKTRFVRARRINLRSGPSTEHLVLDVLDLDSPVFPERSEGGWLLVRTLAGRVGWIKSDLLR
jgi:hypothetical protein